MPKYAAFVQSTEIFGKDEFRVLNATNAEDAINETRSAFGRKENRKLWVMQVIDEFVTPKDDAHP